MTVELYLHQGKQFLMRWNRDRRVQGAARVLGWGLTGFVFSGVGTGRHPLPVAMGLVSAVTGWRTAAVGLGSLCGCLLFWGTGGLQPAVWVLLASATALVLGKRVVAREAPLLIPALCALWVSSTGLAFQLLYRKTPTAVYLLRVTLAFAASLVFTALKNKRLLRQLPGVLSALHLPRRILAGRRRDTELLQLRLELLAEVLNQTRTLLLEAREPGVDEEALLARTKERACGGCPNRRACRGPGQIPRELLRTPMTENASLPFFCRKPGRMVLELRRSQEQYRLLDRQRRREYMGAVNQQYLFLSEYLREQSRALSRRGRVPDIRFQPEVAFSSRSREAENGDRFRHFSGPGGQHFLLLCDGMGTGTGAAEESGSAAGLLQGMLCAGFPPEHALGSLNSLLALRSRAGAVTVDLVQLGLDSGSAVLYKWGAAPSLVLRHGTAEKVGTAGPPPGIRGLDDRETQARLSLRRGETLIIFSDGVDGEEVSRRAVMETDTPAGELAARLLEAGAESTADDATLAVVRLYRRGMLT